MKKYFILVIAISLIAVWPFLKKGIFKTDDGEWMIIRFTAFHQTLTDGQIPVRFVKRLNSNYGYPVFNFLYPAPFYFSEIPKLLGFSYIDSIKITFVISAIGSSLLMFWALSKKFKILASLAGGIVYLFSPYRFADMYIRGSLGESVAFFLPPIILASIYELEKAKAKILLLVLSITVAILVMSHNVSAVLFLPVLTGYAFTRLARPKFIQFVKYSALGIFISFFYSVPALLDLQYVRLSQIKITEASSHLVSLSKLLVPTLRASFNNIEASYFLTQIGIVSILCVVSGFFLLLKKNKKDLSLKYALILIIVLAFLTTKYSAVFWENVPMVDVIQFPWRLLSIIVFLTAILTSQILNQMNKTWVVVIICLSIVNTFPYTTKLEHTDYNDNYYSTNEDTTTVKEEYLPLWVKEKPISRADTASLTNPEISFITEEVVNTEYKAKLVALNDTQLTINTIYFPGFKATLDSKNVEINYENKNGLISVELPKGEHEVIINYGKSSVHLISETISAISFGLVVFLFYKKWQKRNS